MYSTYKLSFSSIYAKSEVFNLAYGPTPQKPLHISIEFISLRFCKRRFTCSDKFSPLANIYNRKVTIAIGVALSAS